VAIVACQDGNVFACRSEQASIFQLGFFSNLFVWIGLGVEWIIIAMMIFLDPLHPIFDTALLSRWQWLLLPLCPLLLLVAEESRKALMRKFWPALFQPKHA
jgi:magnesium-transporting ATPase (P-type)